jgi:protein-S-isoprenylcysteine O-methyltransferase Ste14
MNWKSWAIAVTFGFGILLVAVMLAVRYIAADHLRRAQIACQEENGNRALDRDRALRGGAQTIPDSLLPMTCDGALAERNRALIYPAELPAVQAELAQLYRQASAPVWDVIMVALIVTVAGAIPWLLYFCWHFLLRRLGEVSDAIRGNRR